MRYMRHGRRREWIEATLSSISDDKLRCVVASLNQKHKHIHNLIGG